MSVSLGGRSHLGAVKEAVFKTPVAASAYMRFLSLTPAEPIEWVRTGELQYGPDRSPVYPGLKTYTLAARGISRPNFLGWLLLSGLGPVTTTVLEASVRWQHVFAWRRTEFSAACFLQPLTLESHLDQGQAFQYAGSVVNDLTLEFGIGQRIVAVEAGIMAATSARITATTPTFEVIDPFFWRQGNITLPDPTAFTTLRTLRLAVRSNQQGYDYLDGTQEYARILPGDEPRAVEISGEMVVNDAEYLVYRAATQRSLKAVLTGGTLGTGNYMLTLEAKKFRYETYDLGVATQGLRVVGFAGTAEYDPATADTPLKATLINSQSAY